MEWTLFDADSLPPNARKIYAALNPRGEFYLNQGALLKLGNPAAVRLMYNKEHGLIGIAAAPFSAKGAVKLRRKDGDRVAGRTLAANAFCRAFGLLPKKTIRFLDPKFDEEGVLVLDPAATEPAPQKGTMTDLRTHYRS